MSWKRTRLLVAGVAVASLVLAGNQAFAVEDAIDVVPAATLLLPYFQVDLANNAGLTTLFSVNNASAAPQIAHITFWTDMSRPTLDFDIYLTGYDVFTVNVGTVFRTGSLPVVNGAEIPGVAATANNSIDDNAGAFSFAEPPDPDPDIVDVAEDNCTFPLPAALPGPFLNFIRQVHVGDPAPNGFAETGLCGGADHGDAIARGYITIDNVLDCDILTANAGRLYFEEIADIRPRANVLWGDFFLVDPTNNFAQGETLVHIENYALSRVNCEGGCYTFYGRYDTNEAGTVNDPWNGGDNREPLATVWAVRYVTAGPPFDEGQIICWRDDGEFNSANYFDCDDFPIIPPQPLTQNQVVIFDEAENPRTPLTFPFSPPPTLEGVTPCPWEANLTDSSDFGEVFPFGWFYLNLNTATLNDFNNLHQAWVGTIWSASGLFSVGFRGTALDHATSPNDVCLGPGRGDVRFCGAAQ